MIRPLTLVHIDNRSEVESSGNKTRSLEAQLTW